MRTQLGVKEMGYTNGGQEAFVIRTGMRQSDEDRNGIHGDEALVGAGPQTGAPIDRSKKSLIIILLSIYTESGGMRKQGDMQQESPVHRIKEPSMLLVDCKKKV
eukprot:PDM68531.1 hypothetical protein PRIPAC_44033 [Pristionchus pacificus]